MTVLKLFFSLQGRINRATWWLLTLSIAIFNLILAKVLSPFFPPIPIGLHGRTVSYADTIPTLITFLPVLAIGAKRLHDRGKSGWWLVLYATPAALLIMAAILLVAAPNHAAELAGPLIFLFIATLVMMFWNFIELGFLKGDAISNDYGHPWQMSDLLDGKDDEVPSGAVWSETALPAISAQSTPAAKQNAAAVSAVKVRAGKPQGFGRRPVASR